jgi:hypothetical protein
MNLHSLGGLPGTGSPRPIKTTAAMLDVTVQGGRSRPPRLAASTSMSRVLLTNPMRVIPVALADRDSGVLSISIYKENYLPSSSIPRDVRVVFFFL